jgi:glyoxylase-like metal-dependent hydrolase (beta-lactamase superfamily II)
MYEEYGTASHSPDALLPPQPPFLPQTWSVATVLENPVTTNAAQYGASRQDCAHFKKSLLLPGHGDFGKKNQQEVLRMARRSNLVAQFFNKICTPQQVGNFLIVKSRVKNSVK